MQATYGRLIALVPAWTRFLDSGAFTDGLSVQRSTSNPVLIGGGVIDGRKSNGQVGFNHRRDMDTCRAGEAGMLAMNEADWAIDSGSSSQGPDGKLVQLYDSYDQGAVGFTLNCYGLSDAELIAFLSPGPDANGNARRSVAQLTSGPPVTRSRTASQNISLDDWGHMYLNATSGVYNAVSGGGANAVNIQYETTLLE